MDCEDNFLEAIYALKEYKTIKFKLGKAEYTIASIREILEMIEKGCNGQGNYNIKRLCQIALEEIKGIKQ